MVQVASKTIQNKKLEGTCSLQTFVTLISNLNLENHCSAIKVSHADEKRICHYKYSCTAINWISNLFHKTPIHAQMN